MSQSPYGRKSPGDCLWALKKAIPRCKSGKDLIILQGDISTIVYDLLGQPWRAERQIEFAREIYRACQGKDDPLFEAAKYFIVFLAYWDGQYSYDYFTPFLLAIHKLLLEIYPSDQYFI